ncbi:hypothetical protein BD410DRAFT_570560 [Rickenella mellea]|uniref:Uncharacterized protein n=1 Tax=Rickenella mellea TaxID=50990 RepID=A0A4Y7QFQ1_9AGAM|nr:hypothetical protein BD410DRAFT_570560 [Rickenella mellea]
MHSLNLRHQNHYIDYCFRNCENWLNASDSAAKHIELKDLIFVTGIDNVYAWSMFSFAQQSKNCSFRLTAGTSTVTGALVVQSSSSVEHTPVTNFGPVERHGNCAPASPDQTVFIRRFKLHRRVDWLKWRMKTYVRATQPEGEKYARSPVTRECTTMAGDSSAQNFFISSDGSGSGDDSECDPMDAETLEPLDALLDYILETCPNAHYSCAGDDDLSPFREHLSDWLSFPSLLRRIRPEVYLTANGCAFPVDLLPLALI